MYFRNVVSDYRDEYLGLKSQDWVLKNRVAHKVIKKVTKNGGRFIKKSGDVFIEVDNGTRLEKTKQGEFLKPHSVYSRLQEISNTSFTQPCARSAIRSTGRPWAPRIRSKRPK